MAKVPSSGLWCCWSGNDRHQKGGQVLLGSQLSPAVLPQEGVSVLCLRPYFAHQDASDVAPSSCRSPSGSFHPCSEPSILASWTLPLTVPFTYAWVPPETMMIVSHPSFALKEPFTPSESHSFVVAGTCGRFLTHSPSPPSFISLIDSALFREFTARDHILEECTPSSYLSPMLVLAQTPMAPDGVNVPSPCNGPWVSERWGGEEFVC